MIKVTITGMKEIQAKLKALPPKLGAAGMERATTYLVGVLVNEEVPPSKSVFHGLRRLAYGKPFFTARQARWFFAKLRDYGGEWPKYRRGGRAGGVESKWYVLKSGLEVRLENRSPAAKWIYGNRSQARASALSGWCKIKTILAQHNDKIVDAFERGVEAELRKQNLT